jgi:hypothetical protein
MDNGNVVQGILEELYTMISEAKWFPVGPNKCIIDRTSALDLLDQARAQFPVELAEAQRLVASRRDFIAKAQREAERLVKTSEERSRQLVDEQEVLLLAKAQSRDLMATAQSSASELRRTVTEYVDNTLRQTETSLSTALEEMRRSRAAFESVLAGQRADGSKPQKQLTPDVPDDDDAEDDADEDEYEEYEAPRRAYRDADTG